MKMQSKKDRIYYIVLIMVIFCSCQKEEKVEQVQMPEPGYEEIVYGPVHTVKLLMYNVTNNGDSLIKKNRFRGNTDLDLPTGSGLLVTFNRQGLCSEFIGYEEDTSTKAGGTVFEYDDKKRIKALKSYKGYPFTVANCSRTVEYEYKRSEGHDMVVETEYTPLYSDPSVPAKGRVLSEHVRELHSKLETFYNKHGNIVKSYYTRYELDDEYPESQNSVVSYSDTIINQLSYKNEVLVSVDDGRYVYKYDENGKKYAVVDNYKKKTTYSYPNGQAKAYDCAGGTYEAPFSCTHTFNEEGYFLESARVKAKYTHKDSYGNWTRMLIGHKRPGTILIGEREITYYNNEK